MFSFFLLFVSSFVKELESEKEDIYTNTNVLYGYFQYPSTEELKNLDFASDFFTDVNFYSINCTKFPSVCKNCEIYDDTSVSIANNGIIRKYLGDHAAFEYVNKLKKEYIKQPLKDIDDLVYIKKSNFTEFTRYKRCAFVAFLLNEDRSTILHTTLKQLTNTFKKEMHVTVAAFNCQENIEDCLDLKVNAAPTLRLYNGLEHIDFKGVRTYDNLRMFINDKCECDRSGDGSLNEHGGVIDAALPILDEFMKSSDKYTPLSKMKKIKNAHTYHHLMKKIIHNGFGFIEEEKIKTEKLLNQTKKNQVSYDTLVKNIHVINNFIERAPYVKPRIEDL